MATIWANFGKLGDSFFQHLVTLSFPSPWVTSFSLETNLQPVTVEQPTTAFQTEIGLNVPSNDDDDDFLSPFNVDPSSPTLRTFLTTFSVEPATSLFTAEIGLLPSLFHEGITPPELEEPLAR